MLTDLVCKKLAVNCQQLILTLSSQQQGNAIEMPQHHETSLLCHLCLKQTMRCPSDIPSYNLGELLRPRLIRFICAREEVILVLNL